MVLEEAQRDQLVMRRRKTLPSYPLVLSILFVYTAVERASACAVCFGDPESQMAKGVVAGVLVLVGVIGMVLLGLVSMGVLWALRSRRLARGSIEVVSGGRA